MSRAREAGEHEEGGGFEEGTSRSRSREKPISELLRPRGFMEKRLKRDVRNT